MGYGFSNVSSSSGDASFRAPRRLRGGGVMEISSSSSSEISGASDSESDLQILIPSKPRRRFRVVYDRLRRFVFAVEDFGGFLRFFGVGFGREGDDAGEASRDPEPSTSIPAAARKSPRRSS